MENKNTNDAFRDMVASSEQKATEGNVTEFAPVQTGRFGKQSDEYKLFKVWTYITFVGTFGIFILVALWSLVAVLENIFGFSVPLLRTIIPILIAIMMLAFYPSVFLFPWCLGRKNSASHEVIDERSGKRENSQIPSEIKGFSFQAFFGNGLWALYHGSPWFFLIFIPFIGIIALSIILGIKGNEIAWRRRRWESIEHFRTIQRRLMIVSITVLALLLVGVTMSLGLNNIGHM